MRKNLRKTLSAVLSVGALFVAATGLCSQKSSFTASKASANGTQTETQADKLLLPDSYEEYLPLVSPSDVAVSAEYTAIADGNSIYFYDHAAKIYKKYEHDTGSGATQDAVKKIQFSENGNLYYADNSTGDNFYELNPQTYERKKIDAIACSTFIIDGNDLYFANSAGTLYSASLSDHSQPKVSLPLETAPKKPTLAFWNDELYFTDNGTMQILYRLNPQTEELNQVAVMTERIEHMTIESNLLAYSSSDGSFYAYSLPRVENGNLQFYGEGNYASLYAYDDHVYVLNGNAVQQYSVADRAFTDFEISSSSASPHRLSGATDIQLANDALFINDKANERVSKLNLQNGAITTYPTAYAADYIASDGETIAIASAEQITLFNVNAERSLCSFSQGDDFNGNIKGVANVYGAYYFLTDANGFYRLTQGETPTQYKIEGSQKTSSTPTMLASDVYGILYVACVNNKVYTFDETAFLDGDKAGEEKCVLPAGVTKIAVDYMQTVYALTSNAVHILTDESKTVDFSTPAVFTQSTTLTSFTFGVEENEAYLLLDGNYVLSSAKLDLPTVKNIPVENDVDENIFGNQSAEATVVKAQENALLIEFDLQTLQGADVFPYLSYHRAPTAMNALKLGETGEYTLLAHFDETQRAYRTYLTRTAFVETLAGEDYKTDYTESKTGWLTNAVQLYKYPYLTSLLTVDELSRGAQITLLGELTQLDHDYYHVSVEIDGETKTGYVPQAYVTLFNGEPLVSETVTYGRNESNRDTVWRFAYILLGFSAVCILVDYLILRKKQDK